MFGLKAIVNGFCSKLQLTNVAVNRHNIIHPYTPGGILKTLGQFNLGHKRGANTGLKEESNTSLKMLINKQTVNSSVRLHGRYINKSQPRTKHRLHHSTKTLDISNPARPVKILKLILLNNKAVNYLYKIVIVKYLCTNVCI